MQEKIGRSQMLYCYRNVHLPECIKLIKKETCLEHMRYVHNS